MTERGGREKIRHLFGEHGSGKQLHLIYLKCKTGVSQLLRSVCNSRLNRAGWCVTFGGFTLPGHPRRREPSRENTFPLRMLM